MKLLLDLFPYKILIMIFFLHVLIDEPTPEFGSGLVPQELLANVITRITISPTQRTSDRYIRNVRLGSLGKVLNLRPLLCYKNC